MVLVSPVGALAYAAYYGARLPDTATYELLCESVSWKEEHFQQSNHAEQIGSTTIPGHYKAIKGYYDLVGNVSEMSISDSGECSIVGGSYRDEVDGLRLTRTRSIPCIYRDLDIGFRLQYRNYDISKDVAGKIKTMNSLELFDWLHSCLYPNTYQQKV